MRDRARRDAPLSRTPLSAEGSEGPQRPREAGAWKVGRDAAVTDHFHLVLFCPRSKRVLNTDSCPRAVWELIRSPSIGLHLLELNVLRLGLLRTAGVRTCRPGTRARRPSRQRVPVSSCRWQSGTTFRSPAGLGTIPAALSLPASRTCLGLAAL